MNGHTHHHETEPKDPVCGMSIADPQTALQHKYQEHAGKQHPVIGDAHRPEMNENGVQIKNNSMIHQFYLQCMLSLTIKTIKSP